MSRMVAVELIDPSPWADLFPHDEEHVERLREDMGERGITTPLHVYPTGDRYELLTGHDRLAAAKRLGMTEVPVDLRSTLTDPDERFAYFVRDNTIRKDVDKRTVATATLRRKPEWSNRRIAQVAGCSEGTVRIARSDAETAGLVRNVTHVEDSAGRLQPATKPERIATPAVSDLAEYRERRGESGGVATRQDGSIDPLRTLQQQRESAPSAAFPEPDRRPSPTEANRIARETGERVAASDGRIYEGKSAEHYAAEEARIERQHKLYDALNSLRWLADNTTAAALAAEIPDYQRDQVEGALEAAARWCAEFNLEWRKQNVAA